MDLKRKPADRARGSSIGLGYRVPLVIASPWSRGGAVNSQVFDHTSILMFLEKFLSHKTGKAIKETNISSWRRTVCGDLTSVFKPYNGEALKMPEPVKKTEFVESIHKAKFKDLPSMPQPMNKMPVQEKGVRPSNALPYELHVSGVLEKNKKAFGVTLESRKAGAPFTIYVYGKEWTTRSYAVAPGRSVKDSFALDLFENNKYHIRIDGPNGFMREYKGDANDALIVDLGYEADNNKAMTGNIIVNIISMSNLSDLEIIDNAYGQEKQTMSLGKTTIIKTSLDLSKSSGWYDSTLRVGGNFEFRFAGRVETGRESITDPALDTPVS
jgi:phospholipase C